MNITPVVARQPGNRTAYERTISAYGDIFLLYKQSSDLQWNRIN